MVERRCFWALVAAGALLLGAWSLPAAEKDTVTPWTYATVEDILNVGEDVAVALDPDTGAPFVTYYDVDADWLWFARLVGGIWYKYLVDTDGGRYSSIVVWKAPGDPFPTRFAISYQGSGGGSLKVAMGQCDDGACGFEPELVDTAMTPLGLFTGRYTSVVYNDWGPIVAVAYQDGRYGVGGAVRYAQTVTSGGNCGYGSFAGQWQCDTLTADSGVGNFNWMTVNSGANRWPQLSYHWLLPSDDDIAFHRWWNGSGWGSHNHAIAWHESGASVSHVVDASGAMRGSFLDQTTGELVYLRDVPPGTGNCGGLAHQCDVIDEVGGVELSSRTAGIAADSAGAPIIAYRDATVAMTSSLKLAQPYEAAPPGSVANCGPFDYVLGRRTWVCTVADAGSTEVYIARGVAIAANAHGTAVAYQSFNDSTNQGSLEVMYRFQALFADGFDSGATGGWSSAVP